MSSGKSARSRTDGRSKAKSVLATLERLSGSSTPDKDQTRYLCHKLLQLVNDQESAKKDVASKAGLDIILLTLENCSDHPTCAALVGTLTEISQGGSTAIKRLISHDATRVLLHIVSYMGAEFDWRLLSAIMHLLAKLGPKDRRFALRARLTGSLPVILNTIRSSFTHSSQSRLLPISLTVLKLTLTSSTNATLLGRAGAVHVFYRIVVSLPRKQAILLKNSYATLNLLVRYSKSNAGRAIKLGLTTHLIKMHQDYHKHDFKHQRHSAIRKSILNIIKNIVSLKSGRKAFTEGDGLLVLYKTCKDYLAAENNDKSTESFFTVAIIIIRRCQAKLKLPIINSRCSFAFPLPGLRERSDSTESNNFSGVTDDELDFVDDNLSNDELVDLDDTPSKRKESGTSVSMTSDSILRDVGLKAVSRSNEDLKMYEDFFPELSAFQVFEGRSRRRMQTSAEIDAACGLQKSRTRLFALPEVKVVKSAVQTGYRTSNFCFRDRPGNASTNGFMNSFDILESEGSFIDDRNSAKSSAIQCDQDRARSFVKASTSLGSGEDSSPGNIYSSWPKATSTNGVAEQQDLYFPPSCIAASALEGVPYNGYTKAELANIRMQAAEAIQKVAANVKSSKEFINQLSQADAWGSVAPDKSEKQANKRFVQKLIRSMVLEDLARSLLPEDTINKLVYTSDDKVFDRTSLNVADNGHQVIRCDIQAPSEPRLNDSTKAGNRRPNSGRNGSESPSLSSQRSERLVLKLPSQDVDSNSTSVSDDTWPGVHLEKPRAGSSNMTSLSSAADRRSASSASSRGGTPQPQNPPLQFDSHFESGNLRAAFQIREYEYDLILNPDCNSNHHFQWFYFKVSHMKSGKSYRFNIINCEKKGSVINEGMQPVMYSMIEAKLGRPHWVRIGKDTCYYRNHFLRNFSSAGGSKKSTFFTLTFTVTFQHDRDTCYFAYHYPYTYTKLQLDLQQFLEKVDTSSMYVRKQTFCNTLAGNSVPVITITAPPDFSNSTSQTKAIEEFMSRPYVFLTARVHPGESNSSWTMRGSLKLLLTPPISCFDDVVNPLSAVADDLRRKYIFKIVPMLNPDGVINGHHRCSLTGEDLNRAWLDPNPNLFPTIYHTKGLMQYLHSIKKAPFVYCDYHGHSRRMNVFLYGCSHRDSIDAGETQAVVDGPMDQGHKTLPKLLDHFAAPFSLKNCSFVVEKSKLSTARVVVWKEFGVTRSYTMESTYCGCDQGVLDGKQINTKELEDMGSKFCEVLLHLDDQGYTAIYDSDNDENLNALNNASRGSDDEEDTERSPACPANSDAELTPDDEVWSFDEAYGTYPSANENENNSSFREMLAEQRKSAGLMDLSLWTYELDDIVGPMEFQQPAIMSDLSDVTSDQSVTLGESSADNYLSSDTESRLAGTYVSGRISQATGRVHDLNSDEIVRTAPRPFESGLVLRKAYRRSTSPNAPSTSKAEPKFPRAKKRSGRRAKD